MSILYRNVRYVLKTKNPNVSVFFYGWSNTISCKFQKQNIVCTLIRYTHIRIRHPMIERYGVSRISRSDRLSCSLPFTFSPTARKHHCHYQQRRRSDTSRHVLDGFAMEGATVIQHKPNILKTSNEDLKYILIYALLTQIENICYGFPKWDGC